MFLWHVSHHRCCDSPMIVRIVLLLFYSDLIDIFLPNRNPSFLFRSCFSNLDLIQLLLLQNFSDSVFCKSKYNRLSLSFCLYIWALSVLSNPTSLCFLLATFRQLPKMYPTLFNMEMHTKDESVDRLFVHFLSRNFFQDLFW